VIWGVGTGGKQRPEREGKTLDQGVGKREKKENKKERGIKMRREKQKLPKLT